MLGRGIIRGLIETARNFIGSYYDPARLTTVQYPEEKLVAAGKCPHRCRFWFTTAKIPWPACVAPPAPFALRNAPPIASKLSRTRRKSRITSAKCSSIPRYLILTSPCAWDAASAPKSARSIPSKWTTSSNWRAARRVMVLEKSELAKSNEYFRSLHPGEASTVDAAREEEQRKAQAKKAAAAATIPAPTP